MFTAFVSFTFLLPLKTENTENLAEKRDKNLDDRVNFAGLIMVSGNYLLHVVFQFKKKNFRKDATIYLIFSFKWSGPFASSDIYSKSFVVSVNGVFNLRT